MFEKCDECGRKDTCPLKKHCTGCDIKEECDLLEKPGVKLVCEDMGTLENTPFSFTDYIICKRNEKDFYPKEEKHHVVIAAEGGSK